MTFRQGAQHRRCRSLTFVSTITPDCERHEFRNTADIFFFPIRESMLKSFVSRETFLVRSQKGKKCVSKDIFCSPTTIVDDNNNKHRCRQCPSRPEHFPKVRTTYTHSYKVTAWCLLLLLRVVATKMKTLMPISAFGDEVSPKSIGIKVNIEIT